MRSKFFILSGTLLISVLLIGCGEESEADKDTEASAAETEDLVKEENEEEVQEESTTEEEEIKEEEDEEEEIETEPLPIPDPIVYEGDGDDVIEIEAPEEGPVVLSITGNADARHFAVKGFDNQNNNTVLFVNTTDPYEGITLDPGGTTTLLEVSAAGPWTIESQSARSLRVLDTSDQITGTGDEVILVNGDAATVSVEGNAAERHFAVKGYNPYSYLIVNTTDQYSGKNRFEKDTLLLEITATGEWSIELD
jgi:hypothetical protein